MNIQDLDFEEFLNRIDNLNFIGIAIDLKNIFVGLFPGEGTLFSYQRSVYDLLDHEYIVLLEPTVKMIEGALLA